MECLAQLLSRIRLSLGFRIVDHDPYRPIGGQFAGPADDEVFRFLVEIALPERKWVQRMKSCATLLTRNSIKWPEAASVMIDLTWEGFGLTRPGNTAGIQATGIRCADSTMTVNAD